MATPPSGGQNKHTTTLADRLHDWRVNIVGGVVILIVGILFTRWLGSGDTPSSASTQQAPSSAPSVPATSNQAVDTNDPSPDNSSIRHHGVIELENWGQYDLNSPASDSSWGGNQQQGSDDGDFLYFTDGMLQSQVYAHEVPPGEDANYQTCSQLNYQVPAGMFPVNSLSAKCLYLPYSRRFAMISGADAPNTVEVTIWER